MRIVLAVFKWVAKYKYIIVLCGLIPWLVFFDQYSLVDLLKQRARMEELEQTKRQLQENILTNERKYQNLMGSDEEIEKFAREVFFFKKDDEDIFEIKKKNSAQLNENADTVIDDIER